MSGTPSISLKSEPNLKVNDESLNRWVIAFCVIRFDLEPGQVIEECYPPGCLTEEEELGTAFNSFPDSISQHYNRSSIHDCIFFFRFRRHEKLNTENVTSLYTSPKPLKEPILQGSKKRQICDGSKFLYGFVFNRQRHDEKLKRGGEEKSVVILSHCPYSTVFRPLLQIMGPLFFDIGKKALEHIAAYVSMWPDPIPGKLIELPIGNVAFKVPLPPAYSLPLNERMWLEESSTVMVPFVLYKSVNSSGSIPWCWHSRYISRNIVASLVVMGTLTYW